MAKDGISPRGVSLRVLAAAAAAAVIAACASETAQNTRPAPDSGGGDYGRKASECGVASYYADSLAGNSTASGEAYRPAALTAAHRTLPFGTMVRVVRRDTGQAVEVRVNDRGPFVKGRIIDLSRAAATRIDLIQAGVAEVCLYVR